MLSRNNKSWPRRFLALGLILATVAAWACSVPVFRYALEKWPSDPYQAIVFHRGPLSGDQQTIVRSLGPSGTAGKSHANLAVRTVDLAQNPDARFLVIWQALKSTELPAVILKYPTPTGLNNVISSAPLSANDTEQIINSLARQEIIDRLGQGESAVWVLVESGNHQKDDAVAALLDERLTYLAATLKLPKLEAQDITDKLVSVSQEELKLEFSSYRLSRTNSAEQVFVNMLLGTEPDLKDTPEPVVFPIFGRGRALYALIGKGIKRETIDLAATFLIGKCSCQVKELNPGTDLLLAADWDNLMKTGRDSNLPVFTNAPAAGPETVLIRATEPANPASPVPVPATTKALTGSVSVSVGAVSLLAVGLLAGGFLLFRPK